MTTTETRFRVGRLRDPEDSPGDGGSRPGPRSAPDDGPAPIDGYPAAAGGLQRLLTSYPLVESTG